MYKKVVLLALISFILFSFTVSQDTKHRNDNSYVSGEYLKYEVGYGWIIGAEAFLNLETTTYKGKKIFYAKGYGKTIGIADAIYNVYDTYESYFDIHTGLPYHAVEDQTEGPHYTYHIDLDFLPEKNKIIASRKVKKDSIPNRTFDILSAIYELRNIVKKDIQIGDKITIHTFFQGENWDLIVRFIGYETIKLSFGKVKCYKFMPIVQKGTVFTDKDALNVWVSADEAKIPVKIAMKLWVGSFSAELSEYKGLKYPMNVSPK